MTDGGYRICSRCIMDTSDREISFDAGGRCNHCLRAEALLAAEPHGLPPPEKARGLAVLVETIRAAGRGKAYDCIIGVSGGVDSTFVAVAVRRLGLRPLAVHLDNGWDSKLAVTNVENVLRKLDIDLTTHVIDWDEFKDLQLAFLRASTPDSEIPTDHAIVAVLYRAAARHRVKTILGGTNLATESILPRSWSRGHNDWKYIRSVHRTFGRVPLRTFPHRSLWRDIADRRLRRIRWVSLLDYLDYDKAAALRLLASEVGFEDYGGKHHESIYTRFFQGYILPAKFGFDKRRAHLWSLILSGQVSRDAALAAMTEEPYPRALLAEDRAYVTSKLGLSDAEFEAILRLPPRRFEDYPSYATSWYIGLVRALGGALRRDGGAMIVVVDHGMGNIGSILNMIKKAGGEARASSDPGEVAAAAKLVLPGVGAFDHGMKSLAERDLVPALNQAVLDRGAPILGICLGMHLFTRASEEGSLPGLGWLDATTVRFHAAAPGEAPLKVPHMGWNRIEIRRDSVLLAGVPQPPSFYFVHSYHVVCADPADVVAVTTHGVAFPAVIERRHLFATQFHPEKSHKYGLRVIANFVRLEA